MIKIMIIDDHQVIIDGIKAMLTDEPQIQVALEATSGKEALSIVDPTMIDAILLDINIPDMSGFEICAKLKGKYPSIKIIALSMHDESGYISKMVKAGVDGYLLKNTGKQEIIEALKSVHKGEKYFSKAVTDSLMAGMVAPRQPKSTDFIQKITRREKEILKLIVEELTTDEIAERLFISNSTVMTHRKSLLRKLNAKNSAGLVKVAYEFGLLNE